MRFLKRLTVWLVETACEALLLSIFMMFTTVGSASEHGYASDIMIIVILIVIMFMCSTGYIFTTAIVRAFWNGRTLWLYPFVAALMFLIHAEIFIRMTDTTIHRKERLAGACITFAVTFAGGWVLRKWKAVGTPLIS